MHIHLSICVYVCKYINDPKDTKPADWVDEVTIYIYYKYT